MQRLRSVRRANTHGLTRGNIVLHAVSHEEGWLLDDVDVAAERSRRHWEAFFRSHENEILAEQFNTIVRYVQPSPEGNKWEFSWEEFEVIVCLSRESAPGADGLPNSAYRCAGGARAPSLSGGCSFLLRGGLFPLFFLLFFLRAAQCFFRSRVRLTSNSALSVRPMLSDQ